MKAIILSAGMGTRLGELTREIPKPMLSLHGIPLLEYNIRYLVKYGFTDILINLHFLPDIIRQHVADGSRWGACVKYSYESLLLGTAGAIRNCPDFFAGDEPFLAIYGDLLTNQSLQSLLLKQSETNAAGVLFLHQRQGSNSLVQMDADGVIQEFIERPTEEQRAKNPFPWVNSGIQLLTWQLFEDLPIGQPADLPKNIYIPLLKRYKLYGLPLTSERVAIDSPQRYEQAKALAAKIQRDISC